MVLPFVLLGVDSDNGSEFINWHLKSWCERKQIQLTRGRPYKKEDNAHIEQKNWMHVRKLLGWDRCDTHEAVEAINNLYCNELRLWLNRYLPSVKLVKKVRVGCKVRRVYDGPRTPFERVKACPQADRERVARRIYERAWTRFSWERSSNESWHASRGWRIDVRARGRNSKGRKKRHNKCGGETAVEKTLALRAWKSLRDSHFPTAATTTNFRLHLKCLDNPS